MHRLQAAERLGGKSLAVGIEIWMQANIRRDSGGITLSTKRLKIWNMDRHTVYRILHKMETAGLISVSRSRSSLVRVTIYPGAPCLRAR